jgi:hypothetical protein
MTNGKVSTGKSPAGKAPATLDDIWEELRTANRLKMADLALNGVTQRDIAAVIDKDESVVSRMFPGGLLRRLAKGSKGMATVSED